jgi:hypothetical protein
MFVRVKHSVIALEYLPSNTAGCVKYSSSHHVRWMDLQHPLLCYLHSANFGSHLLAALPHLQ